MDEPALAVHPPRPRRGELLELGDRRRAALLREPEQAHEHLGGRLRVGQRAVARLHRDAEEERERGEARPRGRGRRAGCARAARCRSRSPASRLPVSRSSSRFTNPTSKRALCATSTASPANVEKRRSASRTPGRAAAARRPTARSAARSARQRHPRRDERLERSRISSSRTRTAPISQIRAEACASPVVSRSKTTKCASSSGGSGADDERDERPAPDEPCVLLDERRRAATERALRAPAAPRRGARRPRSREPGRRAPREARPAGRASRSRAAPSRSYTNICSYHGQTKGIESAPRARAHRQPARTLFSTRGDSSSAPAPQ